MNEPNVTEGDSPAGASNRARTDGFASLAIIALTVALIVFVVVKLAL